MNQDIVYYLSGSSKTYLMSARNLPAIPRIGEKVNIQDTGCLKVDDIIHNYSVTGCVIEVYLKK